MHLNDLPQTPDLTMFQLRDENGTLLFSDNSEPVWQSKPQKVSMNDVRRVMFKGKDGSVLFELYKKSEQYKWFKKCLYIKKENEIARAANSGEALNVSYVGYDEMPLDMTFEEWIKSDIGVREARRINHVILGSDEGTLEHTVGEYIDALMGQVESITFLLGADKESAFSKQLAIRRTVKERHPTV